MRANQVQKTDQILNRISNNFINHKTFDNMSKSNDFTKKELWSYFLITFEKMYGKDFKQDKQSTQNLAVIFYYFLGDNRFINCDNLRKDISVPSLDKGLLIIGGFGLGKTDYLKVFENMFINYPRLRFKFYTAKALVRQFENCQTPMDKQSFFKDTERSLMFIDDISSERLASNYGHVDIIQEVILNRYDKKLRTFASCNYTTNDNCAEQTLQDLGLRYGGRMFDRFHEMFNIIEFKGKSFRR